MRRSEDPEVACIYVSFVRISSCSSEVLAETLCPDAVEGGCGMAGTLYLT